MFHIKSYEKAESIDHAIELLKANSDARLLSGGTDVLIRLREGKKAFQHLVDIHGLEELKVQKIQDDGTIYIGSAVTFSEAMQSDIILQHVPILALASGTVGGPQVRNVATIGGNICNGVTSADSASALMCLNTELKVEGPAGQRLIPISKFYLGPGKVDIKPGEILTAFLIRSKDYEETSGYYHKYAMRNAMDIATIGCAAICRVKGDTLGDLRLSFGVAAPTPIRCSDTEKAAIGQKISQSLISDIENQVVNEVTPRTSWRASKEFRLQIIQELAGRVVTKAIQQAGGNIQ